MGLRDGPHHVHDVETLFLINRREVERGSSRAVRALFPREFSGKKSSGERTPNQQAEPLVLDQGNGLLLQVPSDERVIRLCALECLEAPALRSSQRLHQLPGFHVGAADVAHLAGPDEIGEGDERLFDVGLGVGTVDLIEVDVVGAETFQARFGGLNDVQARQPDLVCARAHATAHFGGDYHVLTLALQRATENLLGFTARVNVGRVEEVDALVQRAIHQRVGVLLVEGTDHFPLATEGHGAEAEF